MSFSRGNKGTSSAYDRFFAYDEKPKTYILRELSGGVSTKTAGTHAVASIMNMESDGGALVSLASPKKESFAGGFASGDVREHRYADGIWLFRKGRTLYARVREEIFLVGSADMLTQESGAIYYIGNAFYVIDGENVWRVGRDLGVSPAIQNVPVCFTDVSRDGLLRTENEKPNPFCRYIDIVLSDESSHYQTLPSDIAYDPDDVTLFQPNSEEEIAAGRHSFDGSVIWFIGVSPAGYRIRLKLLDADDESMLSFSSTSHLREILSETKSLLSYTDPSGNPYFLTWKESEIILIERTADMFSRFSEKMMMRIPMDEVITAIIAYSDGYLLFTETAVKKLHFETNELLEIIAKTEIFKHDFGSDMPGSVCGFDDKILFASSRAGIFYINKFGITERDASRKISENIEDGSLGFFSHTEEEFRAARGSCAFGKYYLTVGHVTYIWDYSAKLPSSVQSREDEESMVWTISDRFSGMDFLQSLTDRLYLWDADTQTLRYLKEGKTEEDETPSSFTTTPQDLGTTQTKIMTKVGIRYRSALPLSVKLIFDGEESAAAYTLPQNEAFSTAWISIYAKKFEKAAISVFSKGFVAVEAVTFQYI